MPRISREKMEVDNHIMLKGINQQTIFEDEEDNKKFIDIFETYQKEIDYKIYAYCLMGNHVQLSCISIITESTTGDADREGSLVPLSQNHDPNNFLI